ncbi:MAG TPA: hypothetical protein VGB35_08480 [Gammaproteobacteria bacterium]|jgi:hypothetical protein
MQWEFTPEEVVKGEVDYGLEAFRRDLFEEVASNLHGDDEAFVEQGFDLIYDLCYWMATGREFADFAATLTGESPLDADVLQAIGEHMQDNITMLGAILQRMIMDGVEQGLPVEQAVTRAAQRHSQVAEG